jgi:hypothetical protein
VKVLDVGSSDGYLSTWLARHLDTGVSIHGLDPDPAAVDAAQARADELGIDATYKVGQAEDAADLFEPGSFDAVAAFEVIEHVADVDQFLTALERMVKPDGLVFLSTPDGTFGEGSNPNHLRVYRSIDLADVLRRRGRLVDMTVGSDQVTVAAYRPEPRLADVAIYCGPGWDTWAPHDIGRRGLGGSETAAVRLAEQLSAIGWVVTVYGEVEQCCYLDVIFRKWEVFDPMVPRHAVISSRLPQLFDRRIAAPKRLLWCHDTDFGGELTARRAEQIDAILVLSRWHLDHVAGLYPFAKDKLVQVRNGINLDYFREP